MLGHALAVARYNLALLGHSQRYLPASILLLGVLGMQYTERKAPVLPEFSVSAGALLVVSCWLTIALIDVSPQGASLTQAGQPVRHAPDVDALTAQTLGWPLPVSGLREWLQGIAQTASGQRFVATPQQSEVVTRDGWQIRYANWQPDDTPPPQARPKRIDLARNTQQAGDVSIRIAIDSWQEH